MTNTYIKDKLDEFDKKFTDTEQGNFYSENTTWKHTIGVPVHVKMFLEQSLTDYHNHIVEKLLKHFDKLEHNDTNDSMENWRNYKFIRNNIVDCLQDTNPKE